MYRQYLTQDEHDEIVEGYKDPTTRPHCNSETFHKPGVCAFCDGYYKRNPGFTPAAYATPEANGWGGNMAPMVNDLLADEETMIMTLALDEMRAHEEDRRNFWRDTARQIKARFTGGNHGTGTEGSSGPD